MKGEIPFIDFGGNGETIHFAHANGFPPETYQTLIDELKSNHQVVAMNLKPLWPNSDYREFKNWETVGDDLIKFLDQRGLKNIIGMGHSFGGIATVIAAYKRPGLFSRLVLIEPVVLPDWVYLMTKFLPRYFLKKSNPIVKSTLVRTDTWESKEAAFNHFRPKKLFADVGDKELRDYINAGTTNGTSDTVSLAYSREWEAQVYMTFSNPWGYITKLQTPYLALRGETSTTIREATWIKWQKLKGSNVLIQFDDCGHLLPIEKPEEMAKTILSYLDSKNS
ncbi:alpha/beta hydrolase [Flavobacteriales bacterium]|nr:alpha/beta hydrolase [Flavobacteriales bacterium]